MHAFDLAKLAGAQVRVRTARPGETLRTLDGQLRELSPDTLVIADAERVTAVAGVMGGADSEVTNGTRAIVLESAYFNPLSVRRASRQLGLKTEASMRFERGADPSLPLTAMARAAPCRVDGAGRSPGRPWIAIEASRRSCPAAAACRITGLLGAAIPDGASPHSRRPGLHVT
jgi:phenylalanyl-tRNA synthetase beta chain